MKKNSRGIIMNAQVSTEFTDFICQMNSNLIPNNSVSSMTHTIKKVDVLRYYRESKQLFLNLGSLLISQTDGRFLFFDHKGELVGIARIKI
jgi:hypothetical protein